jgi:hypothetical protein
MMERKTQSQSEQSPRPDERNWLWVGLVALILVGCLALITINTGSGFVVDGQARHYRLISAVTDYPFCPPDVPCPISVILPENHLVVWVSWETRQAEGVGTGFRKIIDLQLPR